MDAPRSHLNRPFGHLAAVDAPWSSNTNDRCDEIDDFVDPFGDVSVCTRAFGHGWIASRPPGAAVP